MNSRKPLKSLFEATGMAVTLKMASFRVLRTMKRFVKQSPKTPLKGCHHQRRIEWDQENLKIDFSKIIFTNEVKTRPQTLADLNPKEILLAILKHKNLQECKTFLVQGNPFKGHTRGSKGYPNQGNKARKVNCCCVFSAYISKQVLFGRRRIQAFNFDNLHNNFLRPENVIDFFNVKMDPMSGCDIRLVFTLPPRDSLLQYEKCVHL